MQTYRMSLVALAALVVASVTACEDKKPAQTAPPPTPPASVQPVVLAPAPAASSASPVAPADPGKMANSEADPLWGKFTLDDALKGLTGSGKLLADIDTVSGKITCELFEDKAPLTVANFAGLARGLRPWRDPATKKWVTTPAYDGTTFHRVISKFMIQGGDAKGDGTGDPGYLFADEIWPGSTHDHAGQLCMANRGPGTNGYQFFITDGAAKYLDKRGHTIFGECKPTALIHKIASVKTDNHDKPTQPQTIKKITIRRAGK